MDRATRWGRLVAAVVVLAVVLTSCEWTMDRHDAGRSGWNPLEQTVGVENVAGLQLGWTAPYTGHSAVVGAFLYLTGVPIGAPAGTAPSLMAFDATGVKGCSGSPVVCTPLWQTVYPNLTNAAQLSSPSVVGGTVYVTATPASQPSHLFAYDAAGVNGCTGSAPAICRPLWKVNGAEGTPLVDDGSVFVTGGSPAQLWAIDAAGSKGCGGSPKVCVPVWRGELPCQPTDAICPATNVVVEVAADGRVYATAAVDLDVDFETLFGLFAFDEGGVQNCSGSPPTCTSVIPRRQFVSSDLVAQQGHLLASFTTPPDPASDDTTQGVLDVFDLDGQAQWRVDIDPAGLVPFGSGSADTPAATSTDVFVPTGSGVVAIAIDQDHDCNPNACVPQWQAPGPPASEVTVANGVVYTSRGQAYDAAGSAGCTGSMPATCSPLASIGPSTDGTELQVVNGWVYRDVASGPSAGLLAFHLPA